MNEIQKRRLELGLTQVDLAKKLGVAVSTVGMWETAKRKPDIVMLKKLAVILNCSADDLLSDIVI